MTSFLFLGKKFRHAGFIGETDGKLAFVPLAAQLGTAVLKPCLYFLHAEKLATHIPLPFPIAERLGIIAYQTIERVHGLSESLAVVGTAHPLLATQTEQAAVVYYQFTVGYADKERINFYAKTCVKPLCETHGNTVVGTPSTLFILRGISFSDNNQVSGSDRIIRRLVGSKLRISSLVWSDRTHVLSLVDYVCKKSQIILYVLLFQPVFREFPERFCHFSKVHPAVLILAFNSQFFAVHLDEFNQILFDSHISKRIAIKEKAPVGMTVTTYVGRRESPVLSFRPP